VVFIDSETEAKYGDIPLRRSIIAEGMDKLRQMGTRGVVLKFFFDAARDPEDDEKLQEAIGKIPVALQARIDAAEERPNPLPLRFTVEGVSAAVSVSGDRGWIPLPAFSERAMSVGFVDFGSDIVPLFERYQDRIVKSLVLCAVELSAGQKAKASPGEIRIGGKVLRVDEKNQLKVKIKQEKVDYVPFHFVLNGKAQDSAFRNKVVILGYDGPHIHSIKTPNGSVGAHKFFVLALREVYELVPE
jgi:CHASE2 domain-containing sensor protein